MEQGAEYTVPYVDASPVSHTGDPVLDRALTDAVGLGNDPGLGLLLDLAKKGEYDPWDVDIVAVTDSYLSALDDKLDARDLGRVGRLIFYAAALLHLKAQVMAERERSLDYEEALDEVLAEDGLGDLAGDGLGYPRLRPGDEPLDYGFLSGGGSLEGLLSPRERPLRQRGLTLIDLIVALRDYDERLAQRELELAEMPEFTEEMVLDECVGSSHQDDLDQDLIDVRYALWSLLGTELGGPEGRVELKQLISEHRNKAASYLALLFLAQDEEVALEQEVTYHELHVVRGPHFGEVRAGVRTDDEEDDTSEAAPAEEEEIQA